MKILGTVLLLLAFIACSEDSVSFDEKNAETVNVAAYLVRADDSTRTRIKSDTLLPTDSVILIAAVEPSRSVRMTDFYWQIDSKRSFSEFSVRTAFETPGKHLAKFILLDRFSDTLQDSVTIWVTPRPVLDTAKIIPQNNSQGILPNFPLSFVWEPSTANPDADVQYAFSLRCGTEILADTTLSRSEFVFARPLPELEICTWNVKASDQFGRESATEIFARFFTTSSDSADVGTAFFSLSLQDERLADSLTATLFSSDGSPISDTTFNASTELFDIALRGLSPANYRIFFRSARFPDFQSDTVEFKISAGKTLFVEAVPLRDYTAPKVRYLYDTDSISRADTLLFLIDESGLPLETVNFKILLDGLSSKAWELSSDSLWIFLNAVERTFSWTPLTISVTDRSGNSAAENFFISPGRSCVKTLGDSQMSAAASASIEIPITNVCPSLTPTRFFWDIDYDGSWEGESAAAGNSASRKFSASVFPGAYTRVRVRILYESGEFYEASFKLQIGSP